MFEYKRDTTLELSILITSFQRPHLLKWGLLSLSKQTINCEYEILVLNDGTEDGTKEICNLFPELPIKYIFTGQRNTPNMQWRVAGFTVNIGIKQALGKNVIITCAEVFVLDNCVQQMVSLVNSNSKNIVMTEGKDDTSGLYLKNVVATSGNPSLGYDFNKLVPLCTDYPFFMCLNRRWLLDIGGYDQRFTYGFEDTDLVRRLKEDGGTSIKLPSRIVHLYHQRIGNRPGIANPREALELNRLLYNNSVGIVKRNIGIEWGIL